VAYDEKLARRIRELLTRERGVTEKTMFGGLAFLVRGNMTIAASGNGGALVRCAPDESDALVATTEAEPMVMRGRAMQGWLLVGSQHLTRKRELAKWVDVATAYARTLPAK
jgi:TfoX/Sxy family transcriptional regulator of competence genes